MLHPVYFQGYESPCEAQYGLYIDRGARPHTLHIIVIQSQPGTSLWNTAEGRDEVLNLVLNQTVAGVRIDQVRYHVILDLGSGLHGITFPIRADIASMKPGNGVEVRGFFRKIYDVWSYALKAGAARCYVNFDEREGLSGSEMERFFAILGYYSPHRRAQLPASATGK